MRSHFLLLSSSARPRPRRRCHLLFLPTHRSCRGRDARCDGRLRCASPLLCPPPPPPTSLMADGRVQRVDNPRVAPIDEAIRDTPMDVGTCKVVSYRRAPPPLPCGCGGGRRCRQKHVFPHIALRLDDSPKHHILPLLIRIALVQQPHHLDLRPSAPRDAEPTNVRGLLDDSTATHMSNDSRFPISRLMVYPAYAGKSVLITALLLHD